MTFQLCIQSNWQRGSEEGWGVMRGAGVFRGLQTNRYHGEPLLSKPPRSQLLTCSVMGLLNSIQYMDMRISLSFFASFFFSFLYTSPLLVFCFASLLSYSSFLSYSHLPLSLFSCPYLCNHTSFICLSLSSIFKID